MHPPERSPERDAAIDALLPHVPFDGWTVRALRAALESAGEAEDDALLLFPGGSADMVEAFIDLADRRMEAEAATLDLTALRLPDRVRAVLALRLRQNRPHKEAIRRAFAILSRPRNVRLATATTARTVDAIWHAVGDRSADWSWYSKRAILASIYSATLLFWLRDTDEADESTLAFLDRRLSDLARLGQLRRRFRTAA